MIGAIIVAVALLTLFVWQERSAAAPLVDPRLFGYPEFCGGLVAVLLSYALLYSMFFLMSPWCVATATGPWPRGCVSRSFRSHWAW